MPMRSGLIRLFSDSAPPVAQQLRIRSPKPPRWVIYDPLVCHGAGGTKGAAQLNEATDSISGELKLQMGGKHLTFSQRVEPTRQGDCDLQC
jgi:hypothetical protein